jgi:hypothetical protein
MKRFISVMTVFLLSSCSGWFFQPSPYNPPTPFLPSTSTPSIVTPTPAVVEVKVRHLMCNHIPRGNKHSIFCCHRCPQQTHLRHNHRSGSILGQRGGTGMQHQPGCPHGMGEVTNAFVR